MTFYINTKSDSSTEKIASQLKQCILNHSEPWTDIVFLCIGSDRMTGDCLGPYVGEKLSSYAAYNYSVYGTLLHPVHALNLHTTLARIKKEHPHALIIAIDASLGEKKHLGYVTITNSSLYPGAGVQKNLPPAGDISITGIVNIAGLFEQLTLQTTRLSSVIFLAEKITQGILKCIPCE